jgi:hypothetical protein
MKLIEEDPRVECEISTAIDELLDEPGNDLAYALICVEGDGKPRTIRQMLDAAELPVMDGLGMDEWVRLLLTCPSKMSVLYLYYFRAWAEKHLMAHDDLLGITERARKIVADQDAEALLP